MINVEMYFTDIFKSSQFDTKMNKIFNTNIPMMQIFDNNEENYINISIKMLKRFDTLFEMFYMQAGEDMGIPILVGISIEDFETMIMFMEPHIDDLPEEVDNNNLGTEFKELSEDDNIFLETMIHTEVGEQEILDELYEFFYKSATVGCNYITHACSKFIADILEDKSVEEKRCILHQPDDLDEEEKLRIEKENSLITVSIMG